MFVCCMLFLDVMYTCMCAVDEHRQTLHQTVIVAYAHARLSYTLAVVAMDT